MMLANLNPAPAAPAATGAAPAPATAAAAPAVPVTPGTAAAPATPFASWLVFDAPAGQFNADGETSGEEAPADGLTELPTLADAPALPVPDLDAASTPAMTMSSAFGMNLPLGIVLPQAAPMPMTAALPGAAASVDAAAPLAGATATAIATATAPAGFSVPLAAAPAPAPVLPAAPFAPLQAAVPASTVSFTVNAPAPAAPAGDTAAPADAAADARAPVAAPVAVPAPAVAAAAPAPRAPLRSGESGTAASVPLAQKTTVATAAQPFAAAPDTMLRSDVPVTGAANIMAGTNALAAQNVTMAAPADVKLPANPADWQQPLREALGDRLQLQLGRNIDQAVIRLDPPQLGRIEIAIRHAAGGALEVNISATNSEVRRQLNNVSDAMRSDLASRQFSDVAVTITATPRSGAAFADQQGQGRGRQPGQEAQENDPGRALSEAGQPASTFSLSGREFAA